MNTEDNIKKLFIELVNQHLGGINMHLNLDARVLFFEASKHASQRQAEVTLRYANPQASAKPLRDAQLLPQRPMQ